MEKRRKIKRIFGLISCCLFLCVSLVGFIPSVSAFSYFPGDPNVDPNLTVYESLVPFDRLALVNWGGWTIPNPMLSYDPTGSNDSSWLQSNDVTGLWVLSDRRTSFLGPSGEENVEYKLTGTIALVDGVHVVFSSSRPFISTRPSLIYFFENFKVKIHPHFVLKSTLTIKAQVPTLSADGSYRLVERTVTGTSTFNGDVYTQDMVTTCFHLASSSGSVYSFVNGLGDKDVIIDSITLDFDIDPCNVQLHTIDRDYSTFGVHFYTPYVLKANFDSFSDFFAKYPNRKVEYIYNDVTAFNFLEGLKTGVSGFFGTEIIPGISFGGLLSVSIGISLAVAFFKLFGG